MKQRPFFILSRATLDVSTGRMWPNHTAPTGRCSRNVPSPSNQRNMRGGLQEATDLSTNEVPVA